MTTGLLDGYLTLEQLEAGALRGGKKTSRKTIRRYETEPDGLPYTRVGRVKLYRKSSIMAWLERRERRPNPRRGVQS